MKIGINLPALTPYSREWVFRDPIRQARSTSLNNVSTYYCYQGIGNRAPAFEITGSQLKVTGASKTFTKQFLNKLLPFDTIRFMDWFRTNSSTLVTWADRRLPTSVQQCDYGTTNIKGVAYEYAIELCNTLSKNAWVNVPHPFDDAAVASMAQLFATKLNPGLKVYLEFSNELWNAGVGFNQGDWVNNELERLNSLLAVGESPVRHRHFIASHLKRVFPIWQNAFTNRPTDLVRVVCGQANNPGLLEGICSEMGTGTFDAVSVAAYFGPRSTKLGGPVYDTSTTATQVIGDCLDNLQNYTIPNILKAKSVADKCAVPLICYESGQHITAKGQDVPYQNAFFEAQDHPLMATAYKTLLDTINSIGVGLDCLYNATSDRDKNGSWGLWQWQDELSSVKGDAVLQWLTNNP